MKAFADDFRAWENEARQALAADDLVRLKSLAHSLKGGAGGAGAHLAEQAAQALDDALREALAHGAGSEFEIAAKTEAACAALNAALAELRHKLEVQ